VALRGLGKPIGRSAFYSDYGIRVSGDPETDWSELLSLSVKDPGLRGMEKLIGQCDFE